MKRRRDFECSATALSDREGKGEELNSDIVARTRSCIRRVLVREGERERERQREREREKDRESFDVSSQLSIRLN